MFKLRKTPQNAKGHHAKRKQQPSQRKLKKKHDLKKQRIATISTVSKMPAIEIPPQVISNIDLTPLTLDNINKLPIHHIKRRPISYINTIPQSQQIANFSTLTTSTNLLSQARKMAVNKNNSILSQITTNNTLPLTPQHMKSTTQSASFHTSKSNIKSPTSIITQNTATISTSSAIDSTTDTTTTSTPIIKKQRKPLIAHRKRNFHKRTKLLAPGTKASPPLDRAALSRGEHVEVLTFGQTLNKLTPYLWPKGDIATKGRVIGALGCLLFSKILNVGVPLLFKEAIDELTGKVPGLQTPKSKRLAEDAANIPLESGLDASDDVVKKLATDDTVDVAGATEATTAKQMAMIDEFVTFLQSPEFLNISTTQLPLAVLTAWGLVRVISSLTNELKNALFTKISNIATTHMATDLLKHLLNMDLAFHLDRNTGSISRAIDRGTKSIGMCLSMVTFRLVPTLFEIILVLGVLSSQCGNEFGYIAAGTLAAYVLYTVVVTQWRTKFRQDMNKASNNASATAFDALMNVDTVQKYNNQNLEATKYQKAWKDYGNAQIKNEASLAALNWGQSTIFTVGLTMVMLLAAKGVQDGSLTVGDLVMVNALLLQLSGPLNIVGTVYRELKQSVVDMQTMFALRQTKSQITNIDKPVDFTERITNLKTKQQQKNDNDDIATLANKQLLNGQGLIQDEPYFMKPPLTGGLSLKFNNVSFSYSGQAQKDHKNIIQNFSLDIPAGHSVAFVGGSGSGKSTLLKVASRQFDTTNGDIEIDGVPIKNIELFSLRNTIGIVPQETTLFNSSVMYNIRYAKPSATDEEVINAAKMAEIHDSIINMKEGYNTIVGERGMKLSGGEKQRISIARLMLLNPPIVFCDEATSSLDSHTEYEIMQNLKTLTQNKTCLYIAHRISTITHCDTICVLKDGTIAEKGTHHELLQIENGLYAKLWKLQSTVDDAQLLKKTNKALLTTGNINQTDASTSDSEQQIVPTTATAANTTTVVDVDMVTKETKNTQVNNNQDKPNQLQGDAKH